MKVFGLFSSRRKDDGDEGTDERREDAPAAPQRADDAPARAAEPKPTDVAAEAPVAFDAEFESAFESKQAAGGGSGGQAQDAAANRELFIGIATRQAKPVKNFVRRLQRGATAKDLIEMCRPVLGSTLEAANGIELDDVAQCITDLDDALSLAQAEAGNEVEGEARELILACYRELESRLPEAFSLDDPDSRRDTLIVHALMRQVPGVGHVTMQKLYAAGFTSVDVLTQASHEDLAVTTGIRAELAERIYDHVQRHHEAMWGLQTEQLPEMLRRRLASETDELRKTHESFEATSEAEAVDATLGGRKRELRKKREICQRCVGLTLAQLDELDLLDRVQKLTVPLQVQAIDEFLSHSPGATKPQGG